MRLLLAICLALPLMLRTQPSQAQDGWPWSVFKAKPSKPKNAAPRSPDAAKALKLTAKDLFEMGIIDGIIKEPLGGAHRNPQEAAENIKTTVMKDLEALKKIPKSKLIEARYEKFRSIGVFSEPSK